MGFVASQNKNDKLVIQFGNCLGLQSQPHGQIDSRRVAGERRFSRFLRVQ